MSYTIGMDAAGRLVLPKTLRERYGLADGRHDVEVVDTPEGILLRPRPEFIDAVRTPDGWVVFPSDESNADKVDSVAAIQDERERRHRHIIGDE